MRKIYLAGHDLAVNAANVDSGIKTSLVVSINDIATKSLFSTNTAVVWPLKKINLPLKLEEY